MTVTCIDASNRPNDIPTSKWVVKGNKYTVTRVVKLPMQNMITGFELEEIDLSGCAPYLFFAANRFRIEETKPEVKEEEVEELSLN